MPDALFINGVFEATLKDIEKAQHANPGKHCYLQPYAGGRIKILAESAPTPDHPITLYISLTDSLADVSYHAKIVGWKDKRDLESDPAALLALNQHMKEFQPSETDGVYMKVAGKQCVNLISVVDVKPYNNPFSVSCLIKTSDGTPLKKRTQSGGWSTVYEQVEWLGTLSEALKDNIDTALQRQIADSLNDNATTRQQRLVIAPKVPVSIQVISRVFLRNPDVVAEVLSRANGICEECHSSAPFFRASDGSPYLEVHHRKMLSAGGEDTVANAIAVCPNCHRKLHFGKSDTQISN